jgi:group I intron endonuclease
MKPLNADSQSCDLTLLKQSNDLTKWLCGIYRITSPSGKIYIGQSINIIKRWNKYKRLSCKGQYHLYNSLIKYGVNNHIFDVIKICLKEELNEIEIYYINQYNSKNRIFGLNLRDGGGSKGGHSKESKLKMSLAQKGRKLSPERIEQIRISSTGRVRSEESKQMMSKKMLGNKNCLGFKHSEERVIKIKVIIAANPDKRLERNKKISISRMGKFGKKHTPESIQKMRESQQKRYLTKTV